MLSALITASAPVNKFVFVYNCQNGGLVRFRTDRLETIGNVIMERQIE